MMRRLISLAVMVVVAGALVNCQNKKISTTSSNNLQSIYFDYDQALIRSDASSAIQGNANYLKGNSNVSVTIEGNCDNRGTNEYNLALGQRRADSAKNYMLNLGISSNRMRTVSYGEEKPVCYSSDENCWQKNRRADFRKN